MEDNFSLDQGMGDDFGMIQVHCIYCTHYFSYYHIIRHSILEVGTPDLDHTVDVEKIQLP